MKPKQWSAVAGLSLLAAVAALVLSQRSDSSADGTHSASIAASGVTSVAQQPSPPPGAPSSPAQMASSKLQALAQCDQRPQICGLDNSDPRAASFDLGQRLAHELNILTELARERALGGVDGAALARHHLQNHDGYVQAAALALMNALPSDPANVAAILPALQHSHDADIYTQGMRELLRYPDPATRSKVENTLIETLQTGSHFAGQAVAQQILPFLDSGNLARFQQTAAQLPPASAKRKLLEGALLEFQQRQRGA